MVSHLSLTTKFQVMTNQHLEDNFTEGTFKSVNVLVQSQIYELGVQLDYLYAELEDTEQGSEEWERVRDDIRAINEVRGEFVNIL